ncbi:acyltransferase family protein [Pseudomonas sp. GOM6]|uniref:acyltransferase family protein n=1 Tax=Pseudomonas sp. GOM6 TaxID=3036944 RepID=UPI002409CFB6|nr:acyltransferase family protein [Pseudomonas sp. GOM6]MDG1579400.1 acyltransferase family protein [Pseudomonas sp. GOM6]
MNASPMRFRADINGLRAWAVAVVVLFHFDVPGFSGGFVGVDVFFVISGFLMTGIIVRGLRQHERPFSLLAFYLARARRILPALAVLCATLLLLGWPWLPATEYAALGQQAVAALGFFSNILFWREAGYFTRDAHDNWLLHTWSLSVEWQCYLILPVLLWITWRVLPRRQALVTVLALGCLLSLLLSGLATPVKTSAAFYLLPTRVWELLAGGLVYLLATPLRLAAAWRTGLEALGLGLILAATLGFSADTLWPGWAALVPVSGTLLVLIAARPHSRWTGNRLAQWLGRCSYSVYLWHWPLAVVLRYLELSGQAAAILVGLALSLALGWASYRLVEQPSRVMLQRLPPLPATSALVAATLLVVLPGLLIQLRQGVPGRVPAEVDAVFAATRDANPRRDECLRNEFSQVPECTYGGERLGVIVIGDSHAGALVRAVEQALPTSSLHVLDWTMSNCPTIAGIHAVDQLGYRCGEFVEGKAATDDPALGTAPLLIINRTSYYLFGPNEPDRTREVAVPYLYFTTPFATRSPAYLQAMRDGIIETACRFARQRPVYLLRPTPELRLDVPRTMGRALLRGETVQVSISQAEYHQRNHFAWQTQNLAAERCGVRILDPLPYLCPGDSCAGDRDGLPLYTDDDHLNARGGELLVPLFRDMFETTSAPAPQRAAGELHAHYQPGKQR